MPILTGSLTPEPEEIGISSGRVGWGEALGTVAAQTLAESPVAQVAGIGEIARAERAGDEPFESQLGRVMAGESPADVLDRPQRPAGVAPPLPIAEARARVKQEGLEKDLRLPDGPDIRPEVLDIMIDRARTRKEREATIARGPDGIVPGVLSVGTSLLVGALDPINVGSAFIPVVGEARFASLMASAGTGALARAGVRASVGAAEGAVGMAMLQPLDWYARTQEGQDWTMATGLRNVMFGAGLGAGLRSGGGAVADVFRGRAGRPLYPFAPGEAAGPAPVRSADLPAATTPETVETASAALLDDAAAGRSIDEAHDLVFADLVGRLRDTGLPADQAEANAAIVAANYTALAEQTGRRFGDALDLYRADHLEVKRAGPASPAEVLLEEMGRAFDQRGRLDEAQLDFFRRAVDELPAQKPEPYPTAEPEPYPTAEREPRPEDVWPLDEAAARQAMKSHLGAETREYPIAADHIIELFRNGASDEEINAALAAERAARAERIEAMGRWHSSFWQFAGPKARTADRTALDRAKAMTKDGASRSDTWAETGWFQGKDGRWRFEVPDDGARLTVGDLKPTGEVFGLPSYDPVPLRKVLDHPKLYEAYPYLRSIKVHHDPEMPAGEGAVHQNAGARPTIAINLTAPDALQPLLHEIQHIIQRREGFSGGTSPGRSGRRGVFGDTAVAEHPEVVEAEAARDRIMSDWNAEAQGLPTGSGRLVDARRIDRDDPVAWARKEAADAKYGPLLAEATKAADDARFRAYRAASGEVEARNAVERAAYGHNSRRGIAPWESEDVPAADQWNVPKSERNARMVAGPRAPLPDVMAKLEGDVKAVLEARDWLAESDAHIRALHDRMYAIVEDHGSPEARDLLEDIGEVTDLGALEMVARKVARVDPNNPVDDVDFSRLSKDQKEEFRVVRRQLVQAYSRAKERADILRRELVQLRLTQRTLNKEWEQFTEYYQGDHIEERIPVDDALAVLALYEDFDIERIANNVEAARRSIGKFSEKDTTESFKLPRKMVDSFDQDNRRPEPIAARLTGRELGDTPTFRALRDAAYRWYEDHLVRTGLTVKNEATGFEIRFSGRGLRKTTRSGEDLLPLVPALPDLLRKATLLDSSPDARGRADVSAVHRFAAAAELNGQRTDVVLVVRETKDGKFHYSLHKDRDFAPGAGRSSQPRGGTLDQGVAPNALEGAPGDLNIALREPEGKVADAGEARGRITFAQGRTMVDLFERADASTFVHEMGHLFLEQRIRYAGLVPESSPLRQDLATVMKWLGVERPEDIATVHHEQFARGFETYLAEGKAPSEKLAGVFARFKQWLLAIYRAIADIDSPINDDVRAVFDRMLATEPELARRPAPIVQALADLPPQAKQDAMRAAIAAVVEGEPVRVGEMLDAAAQTDPRIAESMALASDDADREFLRGMTGDAAPAAAVARGPRARPAETWSLLEFIASRGGIDPEDRLAGDVRQSIGRKNKFVPGFGNLLRKGGMRLDRAREAAVEAGYLVDRGAETGGEASTTIRTLLDAMDEELRGQRVYRSGHLPEASKRERGRLDEDNRIARERALDDALSELGTDTNALSESQRRRIIEIMEREGVSDPHEAMEREALEWVQDAADDGQAERIADDIPGWDAPDAGPAAAPGRAPAAVEGSGSPQAGGDVRPAGGPAGTPSGAGEVAVEQTAAGAQIVLPGAEQSARQLAAAREAGGRGRMTAAVPQKDPGGLFGPQPSNEPDLWSQLARPRAGAEDPDVVAMSRAAAAAPEPATEPGARLKMAQASEQLSEQVWSIMERELSEAERIRVATAIEEARLAGADARTVLERGVGCLVAGGAGR